jgi:hypothetical protein
MKKALKIVVIVLAVLFIIAQFIRPDLSHPPVVSGQELEATTAVPRNVAAVLERSCNDCHTQKTDFPWYSQITPVSWWLKNHVDHGREHLNFSVWNTYTNDRKVRRLEEACEQVQSREMPLPSYIWAHWDAPLSPEEIMTICDWTKAEITRLEANEATPD